MFVQNQNQSLLYNSLNARSIQETDGNQKWGNEGLMEVSVPKVDNLRAGVCLSPTMSSKLNLQCADGKGQWTCDVSIVQSTKHKTQSATSIWSNRTQSNLASMRTMSVMTEPAFWNCHNFFSQRLLLSVSKPEKVSFWSRLALSQTSWSLPKPEYHLEC